VNLVSRAGGRITVRRQSEIALSEIALLVQASGCLVSEQMTVTGYLALRLPHPRLAQSHEYSRQQVSASRPCAGNLTAGASGSGHRDISFSTPHRAATFRIAV
jgi:hypothetical protein